MKPTYLILHCALLVAALSMGNVRADLDAPPPMLGPDSGGGSGDLQVVYAVFGGVEKSTVTCTNVTDQVAKLLNNAADGFSASSADLGIDSTDDTVNSLIIIYNYNGHRHVFVRRHSGPKLSAGLLREAAKIDDSQAPAVTQTTMDAEFDTKIHLVFATYGVHEAYWDVTDLVAKAVPSDFIDTEKAMGGDPEWGTPKMIVIVYDYKGARHFFAAAGSQTISFDAGVFTATPLAKHTGPKPAPEDNPPEDNPPPDKTPPTEGHITPPRSTPFGHT